MDKSTKEVIKILKGGENLFEELVKPTTTNKYQFEVNCRNDFKSKTLGGILKHINIHEGFIGKEVFKYKKNFNYADSFQLDDMLNPLNDTPILFTEELFEEFLIKYISYQIEYLVKELTEQKITCSSTCKMTNLVFEWELECKQELIEFYRRFLRNEE